MFASFHTHTLWNVVYGETSSVRHCCTCPEYAHGQRQKAPEIVHSYRARMFRGRFSARGKQWWVIYTLYTFSCRSYASSSVRATEHSETVIYEQNDISKLSQQFMDPDQDEVNNLFTDYNSDIACFIDCLSAQNLPPVCPFHPAAESAE